MTTKWLMNFRGRPDRIIEWWDIAARGDLGEAFAAFKKECRENVEASIGARDDQ